MLVIYNDSYVRQGGRWLIADRKSNFVTREQEKCGDAEPAAAMNGAAVHHRSRGKTTGRANAPGLPPMTRLRLRTARRCGRCRRRRRLRRLACLFAAGGAFQALDLLHMRAQHGMAGSRASCAPML
jgi:ferric-dicitrate binding protein FerR (iron transport regulator)